MEENALSSAVPIMQTALRDYAALLQELAGDNLDGLTVFGPVLGPEFDVTRMTASSVMVLKRFDLALLRRLAEYGPKLGAKHITAPLVMTPEYIRSSFDSFPLELLEIHQQHATLLGADHFASVDIEADHLRLQCERECKRILMRLRQGLLAAGSHEEILSELELDIGQHLLRTLRGLLWLKGVKASLPPDQVIAESEKLVGQSLPGAAKAIHPHGDHGWAEFQALYADVEKLAAVADEH